MNQIAKVKISIAKTYNICDLLRSLDNMLKNRLAVIKGAALFKMAGMKKVVKSNGVAKK